MRPRATGVARFLGLQNLFPERVLVEDGGGKSLTASFWRKEITLPSHPVAAPLPAGSEVILHLRPEEIMILREGKPIKESLRRNIPEGEVLPVLDRGTHRWVLFQPAGMDIPLEIHLPIMFSGSYPSRKGRRSEWPCGGRPSG